MMPTNLHPLLVHFPIALLLSYVALDWAGKIWKKDALEHAAWYSLLLGLAGTVVTLITGLLAAQSIPADSPALATATLHKFLGLGTLIVFGMLTLCTWRNRGKYTPAKKVLHTVIQLIGVGLIVAVGFFGGELVYTFGIGVSAIVP